jgi:hypothetical protein
MLEERTVSIAKVWRPKPLEAAVTGSRPVLHTTHDGTSKRLVTSCPDVGDKACFALPKELVPHTESKWRVPLPAQATSMQCAKSTLSFLDRQAWTKDQSHLCAG